MSNRYFIEETGNYLRIVVMQYNVVTSIDAVTNLANSLLNLQSSFFARRMLAELPVLEAANRRSKSPLTVG